ncbi:unnamed protein product [Protopolystoma xenopodis]|uniref:Uncharacterized protein n=1 Tax=Protopolystoma xenopodis TaxID=117903 RepID=A0A448XG69_9PLAT|nr:unnamed protein product [Protopolystoma xenopodis]
MGSVQEYLQLTFPHGMPGITLIFFGEVCRRTDEDMRTASTSVSAGASQTGQTTRPGVFAVPSRSSYSSLPPVPSWPSATRPYHTVLLCSSWTGTMNCAEDTAETRHWELEFQLVLLPGFATERPNM